MGQCKCQTLNYDQSQLGEAQTCVCCTKFLHPAQAHGMTSVENWAEDSSKEEEGSHRAIASYIWYYGDILRLWLP
jgi:hypothetical protein